MQFNLGVKVPRSRDFNYRQIFLVMKLTVFLLFIACLQVSAAAYSQQINLSEKDAPVGKVLQQIQEQSGYNFFYNSKAVGEAGTVSITLKNATVEQALNELFKGRPFTYAIENKTIVVKQAEPTLLDKLKSALNIAVTVSGKVTNELSEPLPGVTVRQKGTTNAVVTDAKGAYSIIVPDNNTVIIFSFIGFKTQELAAKDIPTGSVIGMKVADYNLKEVVINKGYYDEKRELSTGDVGIITAKEIGEQPVSDPIQALIGRMPGLNIQQASGVPGAYATVRIRGQNSIANGNDPLYIIDGVPFTSKTLTSTDFGGGVVGAPLSTGGNNGVGMSPFNALNPSDIESIEVLKDADATAIYGSRGANGVILITTKKGSAGDTRFNFDVSQGTGQVTRKMDLLNTQQYLQTRHEAFKNDGKTPTSANNDVNGFWDTTRNTNWQKVLIGNTAHYTNVQGSISGGNANTQFLLGGGYNRQTTVYPGDFDDVKGSAHLNLTHSSSDQKFHAQLALNYVNDSSILPQTDFTKSITLAPDAPSIYDASGNLNWQIKNGRNTWANPLASTLNQANAKTNNLIGNLDLSYKILPGLQIKSSFGYNKDQMIQSVLTPATSSAPPNDNNPDNRSSYFSNTNFETWIIEPQINYQKKIGKSMFDFLLGGTLQQNTETSTAQYAAGFSSDALISNPAAGSTFLSLGNESTLYHYSALYGRINYNLNDEYLINITARRDGSSRFGQGKQFGNFGAVGLGWIFTKEKSVTDVLPFLSFGKVRASYGITGNDQLTDYQYLSTYSPNSYSYSGVSGLVPTRIANPYFGWEVVKKLEGGIDINFLNDRIQFSGNYYRNRTGNELVGYVLPSVTGFQTIQANLPAVIENKGLEFSLTTINLKSKALSWTTGFSLTIPQSKLLSYPGIENSSYNQTYAVGQSLFIKYLYHYTGVSPQTGLYTYATNNTNGTPTAPKDYITTKPVTQKFYGGLQNNINFKGFELDVFVQFVKQLGYNYLHYFNFAGIQNGNQPTAVLNRWQNTGDNTNIQKLTSGPPSPAFFAYRSLITSDAIISDASFIRIKNVALSYSFPETWDRTIHLKNAKIFIQCQNLFTITNYLGLDPETQGLTLPPLRMISLGIHAAF